MARMRKWANKERGLLMYGVGKDLNGQEFWIQDGSWAYIRGVRIYGHNSDNERTKICLSLTEKGAKKIIEGLEKFLSNGINNVKNPS